jgi:hypothetical protein
VLHAVASAAPAQPHSAEESGLWIVDRSAWGTGAPKAPPARRKGKGTLPLTTPTPDSQTKDERRKTEKTSMQASAASPAFPSSPSSSFSLHPSSFQRGQALGIVPDPLLDVQRLSLPPQGVLLLDTDGAREAWDPAGSMFGEAGLRAALAEAAHLPAQAICQHIFERLTAFRGPAAQQDDVTLVVVKA